MNDTPFPAEAPEYDTNSTIKRQSGEAYKLDVWLLGSPTVSSTRAYTYSRTSGLYKLSEDDSKDVVTGFDEAIASLQDKYGAVDESEFERLPGDGYEVMVELVDTEETTPYDAEFDHNSTVVFVTEENDPELIAQLDSAFESIEETVSGS